MKHAKDSKISMNIIPKSLIKVVASASLLATTLIASSHSLASQPLPFEAVYQANYSGLKVTAKRSLKKLPNGNHELRFSAKSWIASIEEFSQFQWNDSGQLVPQLYEYHRTGLGKDRHAVLTFDWQEGKVTNNVQQKPWSMDVPQATLDKLSYQLQLRNDLLNASPDLQYQVADGGRLKDYSFELMGEEVLQTPIGKVNTVKIKRIRAADKKRITYLWLAQDWNYLVVRLRQQEKDGKHYEINLARAELDGQSLQGN
ncbi:hypothetical protein R50073_33950 [Maricurvus nonylphenolicus]